MTYIADSLLIKRMKKILILLLTLTSFAAYSQTQNTNKLVQKLLLKTQTELNEFDVADIVITDDYTTKHNGLRHLYFKQMYNGIEIFNATGSIHLRGEEAVVVNQNFVKGLENQAKNIGNWISAESAFEYTRQHVEIVKDMRVETKRQISVDHNTTTIIDPAYSDEAIKIKKYYLQKNDELIAVWNVSVYTLSKSHWWNVRVNAYTGAFVEKNDWVSSCDFDKSGVHNHDAHTTAQPFPAITESQATLATATYKALPLRVESPNHGNRVSLEDPDDSLASPYGWHDVNGMSGAEYTITRGNNVLARDDKDANNTGGISPDGGSSLEFDYPFDKTKSATLYLNAAITNLFVWNNYMHDVWYHYGFDEESGNFQQNNYSRGGSGARAGDAVDAQAQDGSGTNNANFSTPPDGTRGRMQMFLWGGAAAASDMMTVNSPNGVAGNYKGLIAGFGPKLTTTPITQDLVLADDGSSAPTEACNTIVNKTAMNGKIALIDRGNCRFVNKVQNAEDAGAVAVIIINNLNGNPITMGGSTGSITIPSIMISKADGDKIKAALKNGAVNVSLYDSSSTGTVWLDSDFDNGVISHEYGHGISIRLSGGPSNSSCLSNQEQMGEGWSDFFALVMTHKVGAQGSDRRGVGTYLRGQSTNGGGIRPYPYSTDMITNPVTYDDIKASRFTVPHGVGSIWCTMLWDMYWAFIDEYGFDPDFYNGTGGNNIAMQLVIDGLKLQKCQPGFVDGRDAILQADKINNGGKNQALIWTVFARRGLGYSANQGSSGSKSDGTEAFDIPPFVEGMSFSKTAVEKMKATDTLSYTLTVKNISDSTISNITVKDTLPSNLDFIDLSSGQSYTESNGIITVTIPSIAKGDSSVITFTTKMNITSNYTQAVYQDSMEQDTGFWTTQTDNGSGRFALVSSTKRSGSKSWFISDPGAQSDRSLIGEFDLSMSDPVIGFWHWYNTEQDWDGAVIEIDGGAGWEDAGHLMISNGYNSIIQTNPASAISGREAFTGNSQGFIQTLIDLGGYQGKTIKIRFRMVSDGAQAGVGWFIDDLELYDGFVQVVNEASATSPKLKPLTASAVTTIYEGEKVSIAHFEALNIRVFPNPASDVVNVSNPDQSEVELVLMDLNGKVIYRENHRSANMTINLGDLAEGVYLLKVNSKGSSETIKLIKSAE